MIHHTKHCFGALTLERSESGWRLYGERVKLSKTHTDILATLIEKKGSILTIDNIEKRGNPVKIVQSIRLAIGSNFKKDENKCQFIRTIHGEGYQWIHNETRSFGHGLLRLDPITVSKEAGQYLSSYLNAVIESMVQEEFNFEVFQADDPDVADKTFSCSIKGNCIFEDRDFRLVLSIIRHTNKADRRTIEIKSYEINELIDETTNEVKQTLIKMFPEVVKLEKIETGKIDPIDKDRSETVNEEALRYFLKGEYCWNKRDQPSVAQGLEFFQKAVASDPDFLSAWIGVAKSYVILCLQGSETLYPNDAIPRAKEVLAKLDKPETKALLSTKQQSDIEAIRGLICFIHGWDQKASFSLFEESLRREPRNFMSRTWYAQCLIRAGDVGAALEEIKKARMCSGYTMAVTNTAYIQTLYIARRYEEAISKAKEILELNPNLRLGHLFWGASAREIGDLETAIDHLLDCFTLVPGSAAAAELGYTYAIADDRAEAEKMLHHLAKIRSQGHYVSHYNDAKIYLGLKEVDRCFEELEKAFAERSPWLSQLAVEPPFDSLKTDPRYESFVARICP